MSSSLSICGLNHQATVLQYVVTSRGAVVVAEKCSTIDTRIVSSSPQKEGALLNKVVFGKVEDPHFNTPLSVLQSAWVQTAASSSRLLVVLSFGSVKVLDHDYKEIFTYYLTKESDDTREGQCPQVCSPECF